MAGTQHADGGTRARIIASARRSILELGEGATSSANVAALANVSKALVHYHFRDKPTLLLAVAGKCTDQMEHRWRTSVRGPGDANAFDRCRSWVSRELDARDLELLTRLSASEDPRVRTGAEAGMRGFRGMVESQLRAALESLGVTPTIPIELVADMVSAGVLGLAVGRGDHSGNGREAILDTLWLAVLGLAR